MGATIGMHAGGDAVLIAVTGAVSQPEVLGRWALRLVDHQAHPELAQPYHAAAEVLGIEAGRERIRLCERTARQAADGIIETVLEDLREKGHRPTRAGLVLGAGRLASSLEEILKSHVQLHMAEGEMLRTALREAAEGQKMAVLGIRERELVDRVAAQSQLAEMEITRRLAALGKSLGAPWTKRQKHACLAAWAALGSLD